MENIQIEAEDVAAAKDQLIATLINDAVHARAEAARLRRLMRDQQPVEENRKNGKAKPSLSVAPPSAQ